LSTHPEPDIPAHQDPTGPGRFRERAQRIAHEFNNLLLAIDTNAGLALDAPSDSERAEILHEIRRAVERGKDLARRLRTDLIMSQDQAAVAGPSATAAPAASEDADGTPDDRLDTILVAEDDEIVRSAVVRTLQRAGYAVVTACDGAEAVARFRDAPRPIRLVLLDVMMPRLKGPEAYVQIRAIDPHVPVVFTTGYADLPAFRSLDLREVELLNKPYPPQELLRRVREALEACASRP
jgi:CheY-like chemotaxis protein